MFNIFKLSVFNAYYIEVNINVINNITTVTDDDNIPGKVDIVIIIITNI